MGSEMCIRDRLEAQRVWINECLPPDLFLIEGRELTAAGAFSEWVQQGYTRTQCESYLRNFPALNRQAPIDEAIRADILSRLREDVRR